MEGSAPLPKNAIVLTALQELVLSDSKKVYSASNPAFHWGTTSILYRTLSNKQLPQNQHGVLRCPCQYSNPRFFCWFFLHPFTPRHTHTVPQTTAPQEVHFSASFLSSPWHLLPPWKKKEGMVLFKGLDWNYSSQHTIFVACTVYFAHIMWIFSMYANDAHVQVAWGL